MNKAKLLILTTFLMVCVILSAQIQEGYVKTLGRPNQKGEPLSGVSVRVKGEHNPVLSKEDGTLTLLLTGKKNGDAYTLQEVQKKDYELNESGVIGRQYAFSDKVPLTIVMVSSAQLQADKLRIENDAFRVAEKNYKSKLELLEKQKAESAITEEQYRKELLDLQNKFEKYQLLIDGLAEHYAHVDYDELNDKEREINICIENGELERADSLIKTMFDPIDVLKRNKEALAHLNKQISEANTIIGKANEDMAAILKQQEKDANYLYQLYTIALSRFDNDKARQYIETRAALDTTNVQWQYDAGWFNSTFKADYSKALYFYQLVLRQSQQQYGEISQWSAKAYNSIGAVYYKKGQYPEALAHFFEALNNYESLFGKDFPDIAISYNNIGLAYSEQGDYSKAYEYFLEALAFEEKVANPNHPNIAMFYNNLGGWYSDQGDYLKALECHNKSLAIREGVYGEEHPDVAQSYNNIGVVYSELQDNAKALEFHSEAMVIREKIFGKEHPEVANSYSNIGHVYFLQDKYSEALLFLSKALPVYEKILGSETTVVANTLYSIGLIHYRQNENQKALECFYKVLDIRKKVLGHEHSDVVKTLYRIGLTYNYLHDYSKTLEYFFKALAIREKNLGLEHPDVADAYKAIADICYKQQEYSKALDYYIKELAVREKTSNVNDSTVVDLYNLIGRLFYRSGDYSIATEYFLKELSIRIETQGPEHLDIANTYTWIGVCSRRQGNYSMALEWYNKAFAILEKMQGSNQQDTRNIEKSIADCRKRLLAIDPKTMKRFVFTAIVLDGDTPARQQQMSGEYVILEFADWNIDSTTSLFDKSEEMQGKPKNIVVLKDEKISSHYFENAVGIQIDLKEIGENEKIRIGEKYLQWKETIQK